LDLMRDTFFYSKRVNTARFPPSPKSSFPLHLRLSVQSAGWTDVSQIRCGEVASAQRRLRMQVLVNQV
jgi:hypothetical protein